MTTQTQTTTHTLGCTLPDPSGNPPGPLPGAGGGGGGGGGGHGGGAGPQFRAFLAPPAAGAHHDNKFQGNPPQPFNGNRELVRPFLTQWEIYKGLNFNTDTIRCTFTCTLLFMSYVQGEEVFEWVQTQTEWLTSQLMQGASTRDEYLYDTVLDAFREAFTDTMSVQKAKHNIQTIRMDKGDLDKYISTFERLARAAHYNTNEPSVLE
ncbi:hypothetical protein EDB83DRAFT_2317165 [Lactarius deliciosus]|nr:hypothetical protein EDB83DRAFT_2317165 [Lactarius deliciosus]